MTIEKLVKMHIPMSETFYYILLSLSEPRHGYGIIKFVEELSGGRIRLGSGTVYGSLGKMKKDGIIHLYTSGDRKSVYKITPLGRQLLCCEIERIKTVYHDTLKQEEAF